jgi:hypothetical protein
VIHFTHSVDEWERSCKELDLRITHINEPHLDPAEISRSAHFDPRALEVPAAIVIRLRNGGPRF